VRYSIVDNATLTATERLLGHIPVSNKYALDGDIVALESIVQSILFYDRLFVVDDYKAEYRENRLKRFDFLTPLRKTDFDYDMLLHRAQKLTSSMVPVANGSLIKDDDFRPFLEMLQMNIAFTWRMASSTFWLTINLLTDDPYGEEIHKYSKLWASLITQLDARTRSDANDAASDRITVTNANGSELDLSNLPKDERVRGEVSQLAASLSWLALRTAFYSELSQASGADVVLHPIRHAFRLNMLKRHMGMREDIYKPIVEALSGKIATTTSQVLSVTDPVISNVKLPLFSIWLLSKTHDPRQIIQAAQDTAKSKSFIQARAILADLDSLESASKHFVRNTNKLLRDLDSTAARLRAEYGVETKQGVPLSPVIKVANIAIAASGKNPARIPDLGLKIPMPAWFGRWQDGRGLRSVFRSTVEDLAAVGRLGYLRSQLTSAADVHPHASFPKPSIEDARWFGRDSRVRRWQ